MPQRKRPKPRGKRRPPPTGSPLNLKELADQVGLSPTTVSLVLNQSPVANAIPALTKRRIFAAAQKFKYRPNFVARSLRTQRSYTVGVVVPEVSEGYEASVLSGIEDELIEDGYFYFVASHRHRPDLIENCPRMLLERSVEGLIAVDTPCRHPLRIPIVAVSAHDPVEGVTIIELDHQRAATLALEHLFQLGHRRIAVIRGQAFSSDTEVRWRSIVNAADRLGLELNPKLVTELSENDPSPEVGYHATQRLLAAHEPFTGLFAFNDVSAIGAVRALREAGLRVPEDASVVGFDDIQSAAFQYPPLTTVRQPLRQMGKLAAQTLLERIAKPTWSDYPRRLIVEPQLVVRGSTCKAPGTPSIGRPHGTVG